MRAATIPCQLALAVLITAVLAGCHQSTARANAISDADNIAAQNARPSVGFDRNDYPGDHTMDELRKDFAFTGYWLTPPPGETANSWTGKRAYLRQQGWGFLLLANGKLDSEILSAQTSGTTPTDLGRTDARAAVAAAKAEGFPRRSILFLDQEEGGVLLPEQAAYLLGWTEAIAATEFRPGVYASGQPVNAGHGTTTDTIQDIRKRVASAHLHNIAIFDTQDACPPAPGCTLHAKPLSASGEPDLIAWQYAQSPRRKSITASCAATYNEDGDCTAPSHPDITVDMDAATTPDPSHAR